MRAKTLHDFDEKKLFELFNEVQVRLNCYIPQLNSFLDNLIMVFFLGDFRRLWQNLHGLADLFVYFQGGSMARS